MKRFIIVIVLLLITTSCTPKERVLWDGLHGFNDGHTHNFICESNPNDKYCANNTDHDRLWDAINLYFPENQRHTARRVAVCESGVNRDFKSINLNAVSRTGDHGAFQINARTWNKPTHHDATAQFIGQNWHNVYDPYVNVQMAYMIWQRGGWRAWSCY